MPLSSAALLPLLRVAMIPGVGPARLSALIRRFGSAERVLGAHSAELRAVPGVGAQLADRLRSAAGPRGLERAEAGLQAMQRCGAVALSPDDLQYPAAFAAAPDVPFLVFAIGRLELLGMPAMAVVGTRTPTAYGRDAAAALSRGLAGAGYAIVSGMARGIDAVAHEAALDAGGATIGILGNGIDVMYPAENRPLFKRMGEHGLLLSEFMPGEEPQAGNFPRRNRLIAALAEGVLVVEMGLRSGAQHTVGFALGMGKEVFAVPGPIGSAVSEGTNQLLKDGARMVTELSDVLEELGGVGATSPATAAPAPAPVPAPGDLTADEAAAFAALTAELRHVDDIAAAARLDSGPLLGALLGLELKGVAEALPGKLFRRL